MQCTPQQIEEKKRLAQLKLQSKRSVKLTAQHNQTNNEHSPLHSSDLNTAYTTHNSPSPSKHLYSFKPYPKQKPVLAFYGVNKVITGSCYLISDSRFAVNLSGYSIPAVDIFKTIPTKSYNTQTKTWDFHIRDYQLLQNKLGALQPDVAVGKIPAYVLNACRETQMNYDDIDLSKIEPELLNSLMPFQELGVCFGIDKKGRCLIADDMGLGKTFQALGIASYYKKDWPLLIATTASMKNIWEDTLHKFMPSISVMEIQYMISAKDYIKDANILIVSHDMMTRAIDKLKERNFGVIIIDESHTLKNFKAKCTQAAAALAKKSKRVILLSGTPALSRPSELFSQLSLIDEKFFGNFFDYSKRYCDGKTTNFGWDASGQSNLEELEIVLSKKFMIRRTKEGVLKMLPDKKQEIIKLDVKLSQLSESDRTYFNALAQKYNNVKRGGEKQAALLTFFAETSKIKIPSVCSYILQTLESTNKFLVFAHHKKMLDAVQQVLLNRNKKFIRIDGNTTSEQRKYFVDKFQLEDDYVCAVLSITAANAGITLTKAQLILFAELHWNPSILSQAESRAHRIGQENQVIVRYLLAPGTADDSIWPLLQEKQNTLSKLGLSKDSFEDVSVSTQKHSKQTGASRLNKSVTGYDTLDITTYFKSPEKKEEPSTSSMSEDNLDIFDDGMDDILGNMDI